MVWTSDLSRGEVLDLLREKALPAPRFSRTTSTTLAAALGHDQVRAVWPERPAPAELPHLFIVGEDSPRDFLAWVSTYVPNLAPFTAFARVLSLADVNETLLRPPQIRLGAWLEPLLGVVLGEALAYSPAGYSLQNLSPGACASTFSFVASRSLALAGTVDAHALGRAWAAALEHTHQHDRAIRPAALQALWSLLSEAYAVPAKGGTRSHHRLRRAIGALLRGSPKSEKALGDLIETVALPRSTLEISSKTAERRVLMFDAALKQLPVSEPGLELANSFVAGYLLSEIEPGSFRHGELLRPHLSSLATALSWYGFCAGCHKRSRLKDYAGGLGNWVARELLRRESLLDRPRCDIALDELSLLDVPSSQARRYRTSRPGHLLVEVAPLLVAVFKTPERKTSSSVQLDLFTLNVGRRRRNLEDELGDALASALESFRKLREERAVARRMTRANRQVGEDQKRRGSRG